MHRSHLQGPMPGPHGKHLGWLTALFVVWALWPAEAWAAGGGVSASAYQKILLGLGLVGAAYLITHSIFESIWRRFGFVSGVEYILLGVLVGPFLNWLAPRVDLIGPVLDEATLLYFSPALAVGTGALGLLAGIQVEFRDFVREGLEALRVSMIATLMTALAVVALPAVLVVTFFGTETLAQLSPALLCVGAIALVADSGPLYSLISYLDARGPASTVAIRVARVSSALAIVSFGVIFCMYNPAGSIFFETTRFVFIEWFGVHLLIGASLGVFFGLYLRRDLGEEQLLTVLLGIIVFTSGLAYYLRLSPIFVNFLLGVVLNMMGRGARLIEGTLSSFERPLYIVLFFFAGGSLALSGIEWWVLLLVIPYLLLRYLGRWLGGLLSVRLAGADYRIPPLGRVLLVPGGLSVAMLLNFEEAFGDRLAYINSMYAAMLLAVVLSEVHGHGRARSWLIDATDVDPSTIRRALTARAEEESL